MFYWSKGDAARTDAAARGQQFGGNGRDKQTESCTRWLNGCIHELLSNLRRKEYREKYLSISTNNEIHIQFYNPPPPRSSKCMYVAAVRKSYEVHVSVHVRPLVLSLCMQAACVCVCSVEGARVVVNNHFSLSWPLFCSCLPCVCALSCLSVYRACRPACVCMCEWVSVCVCVCVCLPVKVAVGGGGRGGNLVAGAIFFNARGLKVKYV